jgi:hypothetical protein
MQEHSQVSYENVTGSQADIETLFSILVSGMTVGVLSLML